MCQNINNDGTTLQQKRNPTVFGLSIKVYVCKDDDKCRFVNMCLYCNVADHEIFPCAKLKQKSAAKSSGRNATVKF